jgi:carbon monoxide dehydrogenase subunit G
MRRVHAMMARAQASARAERCREGAMATIRKEFVIDASPEAVWDAMRDVGALHTRLVPGFVTGCTLDGNARIVTFGNGVVAREVLVDIDDDARRIAWSATGARLSHHNASSQVFAEGGRTRVVWIADLLPGEMKPAISGMIDAGAAAMQKALRGQ